MNLKPSIPGMAYLAIPYSSSGNGTPGELEQQFSNANGVAGFFMTHGEIVYSPISHSHPIHFYMGEKGDDHLFWMNYNQEMVQYCNRLYVVCSKGWKESKGVMTEMQWFKKEGKPIFLISLLGGGRIGIAYPTPNLTHATFPYSVEDRRVIVEYFEAKRELKSGMV